MSVTDDIKARLDIVSYINQFVPLKKSGKHYKANCPFHNENTPSFVVNEDYQSWRCFGACSEGGDIFTFAQKYHGWDFKEALEALGELAGVEVRERTPEQKQRSERNEVLRGMLKEASSAYTKKLYDPNDPGAVAALAYARDERGMSDETIKAFGVGYAPDGWNKLLDHLTELGYEQEDIIEAGLALKSDRTGTVYDRFRNRLMVPIRDRRGRTVGFGGRVLDPDDKPKYMNSPQTPVFDKSRILFGLDVAKDVIREMETAVIVEGYMDVITAHQAGFRNVVAQMGTAMTETQLELIAPRWAKRVVLALDSDAAGQQATRRSLDVAREALASDYAGKLEVDMRVLQLPGAKDPDDLIRDTPDEWQRLVDSALSVADFVIEMEMAKLSEDATIQQREAVARRIMPLLVATENDLYQQENVQRLALRLYIPERHLLRLAAEQTRIDRARPPKPRQQPPPPADSDDSSETDADDDDDDEMPPPRQHFDAEPPPGVGEGVDEPPPLQFRQAKSRSAAAPPVDERVEAHLINGLLQNPDVYYRVNGKLREIAGTDEQLQTEPLAPFGGMDFSHDKHRALIELFLQALVQDEQEVTEYMQRHATGSLAEDLVAVRQDHVQSMLYDSPRVSKGDLDRIKKRIERAGVIIDEQQDFIAQALRLRQRRLVQERDELRLKQTNAYNSHNYEQADRYAERIDLLARAVNCLEMAAREVSRLY